MKPSLALVGLGYWGQNILKILGQCDLAKLAVFDADPRRLTQARQLAPKAEGSPSFDAILKNPDFDAVCIASPVEWHAQHVLACLRAGKHVFVEKPISRTVREAESIARESCRVRKHVMVGHIYIHHPAVRELKKWIHKGKLGEIFWVRSTRCSLGPRVRSDVDVLWDYAIHDVYLIPYLMGRQPTRVRADGRAHLSPSRADWVEFSMEFGKKGPVMHGFVTWLNPFKERTLMVVGSKGIAVFDELQKPCLKFYHCGYKPISGRDSWGNLNLELFDQGCEEYDLPVNQTLFLELQHFISHLDQKTAPQATYEDGLTTLRLLEKLSSSLRRKGAWISVKPTDEQPAS